MPYAEWKRKAVHASMGLFALALRWLDWRAAALLALAALLFNLFAMPRIGRGIYRDASKARDPGIVAYPAMVLAVILLFRHDLAAAAALWGMMAFGDPAATIAGTRLGGPRLPWNRRKTWTGLAAYAVVGTAAAVSLWVWVSSGRPESVSLSDAFGLLAPVVLLGACLESLDAGIDDNWIPALPCAALLHALHSTGMLAPHSTALLFQPFWRLPEASRWLVAVGVNALAAVLMLSARLVAPSGALGGAIIGSVVLAFGGWPHYAVLWAFFAIGTIATRLGYRRKREKNVAQAGAGRRGLRHVVANCAVPAFVCVLGNAVDPPAGDGLRLLSVAFAGAFAAALADTLGTELGGLYGRHPFSLLSLRRLEPGTPGAVSWAGIAGGGAGGAAIGAVAAAVGLVPWNGLWILAAAGLAGSLAESALAEAAARRGRRVEHEFANGFNTFVGACVAAEIALSLAKGAVYLPFES